MILLLLQLLSVLVPGFLGLMFCLMVVAPAIGGAVHGRHFTIQYGHALGAGGCLSLAVWLAVTYGWVFA